MRLDSLIRLHRWRVEERRRELAEAERREAELGARLRALEAELEAERAEAASASSGQAGAPSVTGADYAAYAAGVRQRQQALSAPLAEAARRRQQAGEALAAAFRELKKYELAEANRRARVRAAAARREQGVLDEIAQNTTRRGERG